MNKRKPKGPKKPLLAMLLALLIGLPAAAADTVFDGVFASSGSSQEYPADGGYIAVQVCGGTGGDAFTGTVTVSQGVVSGKLVATQTATITALSGCSVTYLWVGFYELPWAQISYTRSAGKLYTYLYWSAK